MPAFDKSEISDPHILTCAAAEIYAMRRARDRLMPDGFVGEPAWDILLQLYANHPSPRAVTDLSDGSGVSVSIGGRWVSALGTEGFVLRRIDPSGSGDFLVSLTSEGHRKVGDCLSAMLLSANT